MRCSGRGVVLVLAVVALSLPASRAAAQPEYKVEIEAIAVLP